jgi:hypothetical protein
MLRRGTVTSHCSADTIITGTWIRCRTRCQPPLKPKVVFPHHYKIYLAAQNCAAVKKRGAVPS